MKKYLLLGLCLFGSGIQASTFMDDHISVASITGQENQKVFSIVSLSSGTDIPLEMSNLAPKDSECKTFKLNEDMTICRIPSDITIIIPPNVHIVCESNNNTATLMQKICEKGEYFFWKSETKQEKFVLQIGENSSFIYPAAYVVEKQ